MLDHIRNGLDALNFLGGASLLVEVEREFVTNASIPGTTHTPLTPTALLLKSQHMWTIPEDTAKFYPGRSLQQAMSTRLEWKDLVSRFFESVYDPYWESAEYLDRRRQQTSKEIRVDSKDIKLPPGASWRGSTSLKTASGQSNGVGFFEYL